MPDHEAEIDAIVAMLSDAASATGRGADARVPCIP
jgi:hypothetical protein